MCLTTSLKKREVSKKNLKDGKLASVPRTHEGRRQRSWLVISSKTDDTKSRTALIVKIGKMCDWPGF